MRKFLDITDIATKSSSVYHSWSFALFDFKRHIILTLAFMDIGKLFKR